MKVGDVVNIKGRSSNPYRLIYRSDDDCFFCRPMFPGKHDTPHTGTYAYTEDMRALTKLELLLLGLDMERQSE
jgi:hypothetical protein